MAHTLSLEAQNLLVTRGGHPVAAGVSFALAPGEALVLRGENGTGKTSVLRTVAGFAASMKGALTFTDTADGPVDPAETRATQLHWLGSEDGLADRLTVEETVRFWRQLYGSIGPLEDQLSTVGLTGKEKSAVGALSTGQRRRLGLLRLGLTPRALWLLDEPMSGLDDGGRALVLAAVATHRAEGGIVLMASHDEGLPGTATLRLAPAPAREVA